VKRSEALRSLSRDHHKALSVAQKMRRADDGPEAAALFHTYWEQLGKVHFRIEEEVLLPSWAHLGKLNQPVVSRLAQEHLEIRAAALELAERPELAVVRDLGQRLADHVRFEERELFGLIEDDLAPPELERLARAVAEAEDQ
jgi:hemerythrin-like domain-containing protein